MMPTLMIGLVFNAETLKWRGGQVKPQYPLRMIPGAMESGRGSIREAEARLRSSRRGDEADEPQRFEAFHLLTSVAA